MFEQRNEAITNKIISEFAKTIEMFDLSSSEARLFAFLYLREHPMTLDEMSESLGKSKTSMSTSVRSLLDLNLVTRVWRKGVRKDLYQANTHLFKSFMNASITKWIDATNHQRDSLEELVEKVKSQHSDQQGNKELVAIENQLTLIIEFHQQIEKAFRDMKNEDT
ncbi:GbsR/MarR family transcriptional regulator [Lentibacillus sp. Marseille-P4043]|uniref:GbsR/MarR family transcriptional regulator n=1 Tax=Lentibacillus sp. Marseille-P4043 TaxID=2040293 RepID=UPI000D0AD0E0|nr:MarR family transcriptional regulator [Lentibacillus sp. Marseille-P4043]